MHNLYLTSYNYYTACSYTVIIYIRKYYVSIVGSYIYINNKLINTVTPFSELHLSSLTPHAALLVFPVVPDTPQWTVMKLQDQKMLPVKADLAIFIISPVIGVSG